MTGLRDETTGNAVSHMTAHMDWHVKMGGVLIDIFTSKKMPFWRGRAMRKDRPVASTPPSYACLCCGAVSYHPDDVAQRYCGWCHDWTGDSTSGPLHMQGPCPARTQRAAMPDRVMDRELPRFAEVFQRLTDDLDG